MHLQTLIQSLPAAVVYGGGNAEINAVTADSRSAAGGACFVALRGTQADGHLFVPAAVANGAAAVVCEELPANYEAMLAAAPRLCFVKTPDTAAALGHIAAAFYGNPSHRLQLVGVTGTNGKTTTATLLYELFEMLGHKAGLISTVVYKIHRRPLEATHTTPDALRLNELLAAMVSEGCTHCFMEVSSHAAQQQRISGLRFAGGIFTNLTHDHLDYHKTFAEYLKAKQSFFDLLPPQAFALTNIDDRNGRIITQNTRARIHTYALRSFADFHCKIIEQQLDGTLLDINGAQFWTRLIGDFNACNICAIYAAASLLTNASGSPETSAALLAHISALQAVAGRFEYIRRADGALAIVDYAHTPDALQNVLDTINRLRRDGQSVIAVAGCGGDRDRTKRPLMARIAAEGSTTAILTSDNPRTENPQAILDDMTAGLSPEAMRRTLVIADRRQAIRTAAALAQSSSIILIAGKGHEDYQIVGTTKSHFDDREEVRRAFAETADSAGSGVNERNVL